MEAQPIDIFTLESDQQRPKFVNPCEVSFNDESLLVRFPVEEPFSPALDVLPVAFVFWDVGAHAPIPEHLPRFTAIKATIRIE